jgi:xylulokinase
MISWRDDRAVEEAAAIARQIPPERFRAITGGPITSQLTIARILWLREHEPATVEQTAVWAQVQHLALRALGAEDFYVDIPQCFAYGLWEVETRRWSDELLALAGVEQTDLGTAVPAGSQVGTISAAAAERTGLPTGAPLCVGAGDQICGLVGMGATASRSAAVTLGTGGALLVTVDEPRTDLDAIFTLNHAVPDRWALFAPTLSAASALRWFRDVFGEHEQLEVAESGADVYERLDALAASSPVGSHGLVFLPYLSSAGAPRWDSAASGAFLGVTQQTERADFARAVMEGVVLEMRDNLLYLEEHGLGPERIRVGGGATRSELWTQIQADVYGVPVERLAEGEATALGAALLAGVGSGVFDDHDAAIAEMVHVEATVEPDPARHDRYGALHATFHGATDALAMSTFDALAANRESPR